MLISGGYRHNNNNDDSNYNYKGNDANNNSDNNYDYNYPTLNTIENFYQNKYN